MPMPKAWTSPKSGTGDGHHSRSSRTQFIPLPRSRRRATHLVSFSRLRLGDEPVTDSANRQQVAGIGRIVFDIAPQPNDEIVDGPSIGVLVQDPRLLPAFSCAIPACLRARSGNAARSPPSESTETPGHEHEVPADRSQPTCRRTGIDPSPRTAPRVRTGRRDRVVWHRRPQPLAPA